jgi:hypothetical protein
MLLTVMSVYSGIDEHSNCTAATRTRELVCGHDAMREALLDQDPGHDHIVLWRDTGSLAHDLHPCETDGAFTLVSVDGFMSRSGPSVQCHKRTLAIFSPRK